MSSEDPDRCKALTGSGERCSRPARENGFCYQHGPDDETVDGSDSNEGKSTGNGSDEEESNEDESDESTGAEPNESTAGQDTERMSQESENPTNVDEVRERVQAIAEDVVGHPLDGITSIGRDEGIWRVSVEVIERKGVPDTQDILGRYEILLDEELSVDSYERTHRFRRDDMDHNV